MPDQRWILLVEDREDDVLVIERAFAKAGVRSRMAVVRDGEQAINYLSGTGGFEDREKFPFPAMVLLDLKMPRKDGFEVLHWIRSQPGLELRSLVVIVLTSSDAIRDVNEAYRLGANSFLVKPLEFEDTAALAALMQRYWLMHNQLPRTRSTADGVKR